MTTDEELRRVQQRASEMRTLAEGPGGLFDILADVRRVYLETIVETEANDTAGRDAIYHRLKAHDDIVSVMRAVIKEGNNASVMVAKLTERAGKKSINVA